MRALSVLGFVAWLALIGAGFSWLAAYESRPGARGAASESWPAGSTLTRDPTRWNLVLFLHPHCPCSPASLQELGELLSLGSTDLHARVIMCKPAGVPEGWEKTALWKRAMSLKGVDVVADENDVERRQFGALTSGQVYLFDPSGGLRYSGGITHARGKTGPNGGRRIVETLLRGGDSPSAEGPVFGCPLLAAEQRQPLQ